MIQSLQCEEAVLRVTHVVILEGMEEVASQFAIISWSAWRIANATYVVWRILWGGGEANTQMM